MKLLFYFIIVFNLICSPVLIAKGKQKIEVEPQLPEFLKELSSLEDMGSRRDIFQKQLPDLSSLRSGEEEASAVPLEISELERYPLMQYQPNAVLVGDGPSRALVKTPENKFLIVREKDKMGNKHGFIAKISPEGILVIENKKEILLSVSGEKK